MASDFDTDMGYDEVGVLEDMGAPFRPARRRMAMVRVNPAAPIRKRPPLVAAVAGVNAPAEKRGKLPLGRITFTAISAQVGALVGTPQKPFRGRRLQLIGLRSAGAQGIGVDVVSQFSGMTPEGAGLGVQPIETFGPLVPDNIDMYSPIQAGLNFTVNLAVVGTIPAAPEAVSVSGTLQGEYLG